MAIRDWLKTATKQLGAAGIESARLDCLLLLEDTLKKDRSWVLAHSEREISPPHLLGLNTKIVQRSSRKPLAYIRNVQEFYGRTFFVDERVLIPRPESEAIIDLLIKLWSKDPELKTVIDIGTGSGCLAITTKLELPKSIVLATDSSEQALQIARQNAQKLHTTITFVEADLLKLRVSGFGLDVILANLPYVPDNLVTAPEIEVEPYQALFSGKDGLDHYRKFWKQVSELSQKPKHIISESLEAQHREIVKLAAFAGYDLLETQVLAQHFGTKDTII